MTDYLYQIAQELELELEARKTATHDHNLFHLDSGDGFCGGAAGFHLRRTTHPTGCWLLGFCGWEAGWLAYAVYWGVRVGYIGELAGWVDGWMDGWMGGLDEVVVRDCGLLEDG